MDPRHRQALEDLENITMQSRLRNAFAFCALFAAAAFAGTNAARAAGNAVPAALKAKGKLVVGVKADYAPFGYLQGDKNVGLEIDLLHLMAKDLYGNPDALQFVPVVASNRFQYLQTGKVDMLVATVSVTPQREQIVDFSTPYAKSGWQLLVKSGNKNVHGVGDLKGKTVAVLPGSTSEAGITKLASDANQLKVTQLSEALQAVDQGRADAYAMDSAQLQGVLLTNPGKYAVVGKSYDNTPIAAACRKDDTAPCDYVSSEIAKFKKNGTLKRELGHWLKGSAADFQP